MKFTESMNEDFYTWSMQGHPMNELVAMLNDKYDLGLTLAILQHKKRELRFSGWWDDPKRTASGPGQQSSEINIQVKSGEDLTPERIMELHGYDPSAWTIVSNTSSAWNKTADGLSFSSKLVVKPVKDRVNVEALAEIMNKEIKPTTIEQTKDGKTNLVIPLFDLHFGHTTADDLSVHLDNLRATMARGFNQIVIVVGGDLLHADNINGVQHTTSGTLLGGFDMIRGFDDAEQFLGTVFESALANANSVSCYAIPGNHDETSGYLFMRGLGYKFPQVDWHNTSDYRLAFQVGKIGFMVLHGNVALKRANMLFADTYTNIWANSSQRVILSGHYHTLKTEDLGGVMLHQLGTPKPKDNYEKMNGFVSRDEFQVFEYTPTRLLATWEV